MIGNHPNQLRFLGYKYKRLTTKVTMNVNFRPKYYQFCLVFLIFPFNAIAECTDQERVEMLNAGVSSEYIKSFCELDIETEVEEKKSGGNSTTETTIPEEEEIKVESDRIVELESRLESIENKENPAYWRKHQPYGLGAGFMFGNGSGGLFFFDYNLDQRHQIHFQADAVSNTGISLSGSTIDVSQSVISILIRRSFSPNFGWYYGGGFGFVTTTVDYKYAGLSGGTTYRYEAQANGSGVLLDIGWQGYDGYYFSIALQPLSVMNSSDDFDIKQIPDVSNHRQYTQEQWDASQSSARLLLGFGWYFGD